MADGIQRSRLLRTNTIKNNPRQGKNFTVAVRKDGRHVHDYGGGKKIVLKAGLGAKASRPTGTPLGVPSAKPVAPQPPAQATPTPAAVAVGATPPPIQDFQFQRDVGSLISELANRRAAAMNEGMVDRQDFDTQTSRRKEALGESLESADRSYNNAGLFYSGQRGKGRGEIEKAVGRQQADAQLEFDRRQAARQQAIEAMGELVADPSAEYGYRGTGDAGGSFMDLVLQAIARRDEANRLLAG